MISFVTMKEDKQKKVLACLECGKYKVKDGVLYTYHKGKEYWKRKASVVPNSGYRQHILYNSKRGTKGIKVIAYEHHIVWLYYNGVYDPALQIDHINRDKLDNRIQNLRLVNTVQQANNRGKRGYKVEYKPCREYEIKRIIELHNEGRNYSNISRFMGISRVTVMYIVKKYKNNEVFKYLNNLSYDQFINK